MSRTDCCRRAVAGQGLGAILTLVLMLAWGAGPAWGAAGVVGGSAQPVPSVTNPVVGQQYDVQIQLSNTSVSNSNPPGFAFVSVHVATSGSPPNPDEVAHVVLACSTAPCGANELPGTVGFVPVGATGCVSATAGVVSCEIDPLNSNRVIIKTNPLAVSLGPLQLNFPLATIRVQQLTRPVTFFMQGDALYHGTSGTCTGGQCDNITPNPPATSCTNSVPDCDFSALAGAAVGTANIFPAASCGDSILDPGETCDPPGSVQPGGSVCRDDCTFCGDGLLQAADGEACDDGNNVSGDGCSATCQVELCQIQVDKQVSCDGVTWTDAALVINNDDGTNGVTCPRNEPVFVRYQLQNSGQVNVANCTVGESNAQIAPGGTVITAASLLAGGGVGPTNPLNPQCTDALGQNEPDTASASCECQLSQGGPLTVTATDTASIVCSPRCGDSIVDPGETCDPPGTPEPNGNVCRADCTFCGDGITQPSEACDPNNPADPVTAAGHCSPTCTVLSFCGDGVVDPGETCDPPGSVQPGGAVCRNDCTFCGDGLLQAADGEACDDGNNVSGDGCSATCLLETCSVKVDKQVSCDGVTWSDVGLETSNEDGTNGVTCPGGGPVFVRYQVANTGGVNVANCTLTESNLVINPGGVVQSGISILAGQTLPETAPDSDQTCTDTLTAQEPNTATLSCECQLSQGGPLTVTATDTATIACQTIVGICRTPGFWAEHAGTEKKNSVNITQAVISAAPGGCIVVCGEKITNTDVNSANSALEAMCVTGQLQLPRQLMAAALNCIMTNGSADCTGTGIEDVFQACNAACPASKTAVVDGHTINCIDAIDCFNNGGEFDPATGACTSGANNCHDQPLCNQDLGLCFEPPGPAGSTSACNQARHNSCAIIQPGEAQCATGTKNVPPETCP